MTSVPPAYPDQLASPPATAVPSVAVAATPDGGAGAARDPRDDAVLLRELASVAAGQAAAENFPVALKVLPAQPRAALTQVYCYARFVDDVGDEAPVDVGSRLRLLDLVDADVRRLPDAAATLPPVAPLADLVARQPGALQALLDLIEANRMDQRVTRYDDFDALLDYCRLSAAPVGALVLHVADSANVANLADSAKVCAALQVLEHCQDVGEDARAGRIYLPRSDREQYGVTDDALLAEQTSAPLRDVVALQVARARVLLQPGPDLVRRLDGWARLAVAGYVAGGLATADALDRADHDVLARAVTPGSARTVRHATTLYGSASWHALRAYLSGARRTARQQAVRR